MSFLLYGIVHGDRAEPREKIRFLGYPRASIMVRTDGLGAVVSRLSTADAAPDVVRLLVYSKIVESFNGERAVIPMRYGCRFRELDDILQFLRQEQNTFRPLLDELDGRVEMSARVVLGNLPVDRATNSSVVRAYTAAPISQPGIQYLAARRQHYALVDQSEVRREEVQKRVCAMAEGRFSRSAAEYSSRDGKSLLLVHFLVPRDEVSEFRRAMAPLGADPLGSVVVTGPWPPYNFVSSRMRAPTV